MGSILKATHNLDGNADAACVVLALRALQDEHDPAISLLPSPAPSAPVGGVTDRSPVGKLVCLEL